METGTHIGPTFIISVNKDGDYVIVLSVLCVILSNESISLKQAY